jgi:hypothetical protein
VLAVAVQQVEVASNQKPVTADGQQRGQVGEDPVRRRVGPDRSVTVDGSFPGGVGGHDGNRWGVIEVEPDRTPGSGPAGSKRSPRGAERAAGDGFKCDPIGELHDRGPPATDLGPGGEPLAVVMAWEHPVSQLHRRSRCLLKQRDVGIERGDVAPPRTWAADVP